MNQSTYFRSGLTTSSMLFNSLDFALFFPLIFMLYWFVFQKNLKAQNVLLLVASYVFYGWWDWRFLSLIAFSSAVDFLVGVYLNKTESNKKRKALLILSITVNLGFLGFFKYYNFFLGSFIDAFTFFGTPIKANGLNIILPVGISFYTFQTLSYSIDVYKRKLQPSSDPIAFFAFVSFFPQLVAGPIERATNLLPQFSEKRTFNYTKSVNGLRQILWGFFKKLVIADNCASYVNEVFAQSETASGSTLAVAAIFFAFQIYGDFSGYSDIAIGTSRLLGFNLMKNFAFPYFSRDIAEFWRRWHISLSTWFRDYVYIPLGGSRVNRKLAIRNVFVIFIVSGFWHGANWTFIIWGLLNAIYFLPSMLLNRNRQNLGIVDQGKTWSSVGSLVQITKTFTLTTFAWIFFRAESVTHAFDIISTILSPTLFSEPYIKKAFMIFVILFFIAIEWLGRENEFALEKLGLKWPKWLRWLFYIFLIIMMYALMTEPQEFIYFQF